MATVGNVWQSSRGGFWFVMSRFCKAVEVRSGWPRWGKSRSGMAVEASHGPLACA
jgi:hypothetical protein